MQLNKNTVNGTEPLLRLIGDLPAGTPVAFEAAFGWGWLVQLLEEYGFDPPPGAPAAVQGDRLGAAEERPVNRTAGRFRSSSCLAVSAADRRAVRKMPIARPQQPCCQPDRHRNLDIRCSTAHADEREAHVREVEQSGRSLPEGS